MQVTTLIVATAHFAIAAAEMIHCIRRVGGHGSLGPRESATETASRSLDRFIRLCKAHGCYNRHTDRPRYVATFAAIARYQNSPFYVKKIFKYRAPL